MTATTTSSNSKITRNTGESWSMNCLERGWRRVSACPRSRRDCRRFGGIDPAYARACCGAAASGFPAEPGLQFGSRYPGDPRQLTLHDFLPDERLREVENLHDGDASV